MGQSIEGTLVTDLAVVTNGIVRKAVTNGTVRKAVRPHKLEC